MNGTVSATYVLGSTMVGLAIGPRLPSTGPALFSMQRFQSLDEVRAVLRRYGFALPGE
mgnify:CR=1 FL=1